MPPTFIPSSRPWKSVVDQPLANSDHQHDVSDTSIASRHRDDKLPHDASVFVGSLPSNVDQAELTRMLMDHLSEHTQIKNIKVVRDSKGGVCAFVQCENAQSASSLIHTLHSSTPRPFLGRILRYEPARAFRTLLISYRTPTQVITSMDNSSESAEIELELPNTMRIWKHQNSRFYNIFYNLEAIELQNNCDLNNASGQNVLFLQPLRFDSETLRSLATYFGPLDSFKPFQLEEATPVEIGQYDVDNDAIPCVAYPPPHNAPRSHHMNKTCWEIKWQHRDDCVGALMTLRRVPHLTVTWAHQPSTFSHKFNLSLPAPYPLHVERPVTILQSTSSSTLLNTSHLPSRVDSDLIEKEIGSNSPLVSELRLPDATVFPGVLEQRSQKVRVNDNMADSSDLTRPEPPWSAVDYPSAEGTNLKAIPVNRDRDNHGVSESEPHITIPTHLNNCHQDLFVPQTPALDALTITPQSPAFPTTPTSCGEDPLNDTSYTGFPGKGNNGNHKYPRPDRNIDPTTLFVGGLEMFGPGAWDEEKVKNVFSRFGGLESVKFVRPMNSCAAFAFVKFNNTESPARAVFEEHNRVYEGRAMRVQLRDCNPPRSPWKNGRGRGRPQQNFFSIQRRFNFKPSKNGLDPNPLRIPGERAQTVFCEDSRIAGDREDHGPDNHLAPYTSSATASGESSADARSQSSVTVSALLSTDDLPESQSENYREWYDTPLSPTYTPAPSSFGSSVSTSGVPLGPPPYPYALPNGPYFAPSPWVHPYIHQGAFQVPYYSAYPVYPAPPPRPSQTLPSPPGSDAGASSVAPNHAWPPIGIYGSYIPYSIPPPRTQVVETGHQPNLAAQPPVIPTGFIQNDQGTLVAVYQPEAINRYLSNSGGTSSAPMVYSQSGEMPRRETHPYSNKHLSHGQGNFPPLALPSAPPLVHQSRMNSTASSSSLASQQLREQGPQIPLHDLNLNSPPHPFPRHGGRREQPQIFPGRNAFHRSFGGRGGRVHGNPTGHQHNTPRIMSNDWNRWDTTH